jgi:hypothetical protein
MMTLPRDVPGLGHESVPPGEEAAVARVVELTRAKFERDYANVRPALRDQHPKSHGCVRAQFAVGLDVPPDLQYGIFAEPRTYSAWIRFSSSSAQPRPDSKRDAHGMSIKVMDVQGEKVLPSERDETTQDFIVANSPVFFCRNASDYVVLASRMSEGRLLKFFFGADPRKWRVHEFVNMMVATHRKVVNPLQIRYWSQTPFALGPHAVKYSAQPNAKRTDRNPISDGANRLEDAMARQLACGEASFDFTVQLQSDPREMPVEDPTIRWKERASPFRKVATIRIPSQEFTSEARKDFAEGLSFTPWHSLPHHRPLGGINRVRGAVYEAISKLRHEKNDVPRKEPAALDKV